MPPTDPQPEPNPTGVAPEEASLLARARAGDRAALERLWSRNRRWVAAVLLVHKPRAADLDDLLQEVATTLIARIGSVRDAEAFPGWLRSVAVNAARMSARSVSRRRAAIERFAAFVRGRGDAGSRAPTEASEAARILRDRLAELPEEYAEPLLLRLVHDLPYARIAAILDLPETTVENRIVRGRRMLRTLAAPQGT
jgi:RNA polymerase sigma-70 factor (ECF subfamily)